MNSLKKILFISHEATITGALFLLLYFLKWLKLHHENIETALLSIQKGNLNAYFPAFYSELAVYESQEHKLKNRILSLDINQKFWFISVFNKIFK